MRPAVRRTPVVLSPEETAAEARRLQMQLSKCGIHISATEAVCAVTARQNGTAVGNPRFVSVFAQAYQAEQRERGIDIGITESVAAVKKELAQNRAANN